MLMACRQVTQRAAGQRPGAAQPEAGIVVCSGRIKWGFPKTRGTLLGVPINKDYTILGSILESPYFGKLPNHAIV